MKLGPGREPATAWRSISPGIAAVIAAALLWFAPRYAPAMTAAPAGGAARIDPAVAARQVLEAEDFWWKRIEQKTIPTTGIQAFFAKLLDWAVEILKKVAEAIWDFFKWFRWVFSRFFTADLSGASILIKLIAVAVVGWVIWKLYAPFVRWISGFAAAPRRKPGLVRPGNRWRSPWTSSTRRPMRSRVESTPRRSAWRSWL